MSIKTARCKILNYFSTDYSAQIVLSNSAWLLFDRLVRLSLGLLVGAWVARYLGPLQYGDLAYILAFIAIFQAACTLGLDGIIVRDLACGKFSAGLILGTVFSLRILVGFLCWIGSIAYVSIFQGASWESICLVALAGGGLLFQAGDTFDLWFQSQSLNKYTVVAKLTAYVISNSIKVALILNNAPLLYFGAVVTLDALISAFGMIIVFYSRANVTNLRLSVLLASRLLKEGWPYLLSAISVMLYMRLDQIIIEWKLGKLDLGIYAAILPIATLWQFIPTTIASSLGPFVARKKLEGEKFYWSSLDSIFKGFATLGWIVCIPVAMLADPIVNLLFGKDYYIGGPVLSIYIFTNIFINLGVAQGLWAINENKNILWLFKTFIGMLISVIGNILILDHLGLIGAALVAVVSQLVAAILTNIYLEPKVLKMQVNALLFIFKLPFVLRNYYVR